MLIEFSLPHEATAACLCMALVALASCASSPELNMIADGQIGAPGVTTLFVPPMSAASGVQDELQPGAKRTFEELSAHLSACGIQVRSMKLFRYRRLLERGVAQVREDSGGSTPDDKEEFAKLLYAKLAPQLPDPVDAILVPELVIRPARVMNSVTKWDGVRRSQSAWGSKWKGSTNATTLLVRVYDKQGDRIFQGFGGLDVLFWYNRKALRAELVDDPLSDREHLREGVALALSPYLGPPGRCR